MSSSSTFAVYSVVDDVTTQEFFTTGSGYPRLFEGFSDIYLYGLYGRLVVTHDSWIATDEILPPGSGAISAICQTSGYDIWGGGDGSKEYDYMTVAVSPSGGGYYQKTPEVYHAWRDTGSLGTINPTDEVASETGVSPILAGNGYSSSGYRVIRCTQEPPFSIWSQSDSGLPSGFSITDLEYAE